MKYCPECNAVYENNLDVCPTCGEPLERYQPSRRNIPDEYIHNPNREENINDSSNNNINSTYTFEQQSGFSVIINGAVAETNTQQYYQSKFAKYFQSLISGEPYQLSHTTFATVFRVEEHVVRGYPENAADIMLYGNVLNIFAVGDDVTVTAKRRGNRLIAKRVFNHSINANVKLQPYIPALVIRLFTVLVLVIIAMIAYGLLTADYAAIGSAIMAFIGSILPTILTIGILWYIIKTVFKRK